MLKVKRITSLIWISPVVAAIALSSACSTKKKSSATPEVAPAPQQVAPAPTPTVTAPAETAAPTAKEVVDRMNALTITIVDADKLVEKIKDGELTVEFKLADGSSAEGLKFQCKSGKMPDVMDAVYADCTNGTSEKISKLTETASYRIYVKAIDSASGAASREFSSAIDVKGAAVQATAEYSMTTVGNVWNITVSPNLYISTKASAGTLSGQIELIEENSGASSVYSGVNMSSAGNQVSGFKMKDGSGFERTYNRVLITRNEDFQSMTDHRMSRNHVTITRPVDSVLQPGMNQYGTTGFERLVVNTYNSAELRMSTDADFKSTRDLFVRLCGIRNFSGWLSFPAFADMTSAPLAGAVRTCVANIDFGLTSNRQTIVMAQALQYNPASQDVQTEVIYMVQLGAYNVTTTDALVGRLAGLIKNTFQPVSIMANR